MTKAAFDRRDWQGVIDAHPMESHDPSEWLRYGFALLQTIEPGPDAGKQQQQAALAFVQAQKEGATAEEAEAAYQRSVLLSLREALALAGVALAGVAQRITQKPERGRIHLLHLHGFKCAGSTLIWSLERATDGRLAYLESDQPNRRLPWQRVQEHLGTIEQQPLAITSHLVSLPPQHELAVVKAAFLRRPLSRLISAYRFETVVQGKHKDLSLDDYLRRNCRSMLSNYQTRHLSPQQEQDWQVRRGWSARPELIDLGR